VVIYSTCTPVLAETEQVVSSVVAEGQVELVTVADIDLGLRAGIEDAEGPIPGTLQLWPHRHGTDAMFLAVLRRTG
jgi:16S rRNA (cytosine967-C5)-methyltransferase